MRIKLGLLLLLLSLTSLGADSSLPAFADYPAAGSTDQQLQAIDFSSHPQAELFRSRLEDNVNEAANFDGHYRLTYWGCGSPCQMIALIDVLTGEVFFPPELVASYGVCFKPDSSLIILNPADQFLFDSFQGEVPSWFAVHYYHWDGRQVELLTENQQAVVEDCDF